MRLPKRLTDRQAYWFAKGLQEGIGESHAKRAVLYYGAQCLLGQIYELAIILALSAILGCFIPGIIALVVFAVLRSFAGGYHANQYWQCLIISTAMIISSAAVAQYVHPAMWAMVAAICVVYGGAFYAWGKYVPADHPNKPVSDKRKPIIKRRCVVFLLVCLAASVGLLFVNPTASMAVILAVAWEMFSVTPAGYRMFGMLLGD